MGIERNFNVAFVAEMALREKQIQQNYRPIIAVHKWFARRPGTLFRALIVSEFVDAPIEETFFRSHDLSGIRIADPFMGGGTPLLEANRVGCDIIGYDINPMAYWIVRQEIEHLDLAAYRDAAQRVGAGLARAVGQLYQTACLECGRGDAPVKYFLWVKQITCPQCRAGIDLFPGYLLAENRRHPKNVIVCSGCGQLKEVEDRSHPGTCATCRVVLTTVGPAARNRVACPQCQKVVAYPDPTSGPPEHRLFAIEYHCPTCKPRHEGRFFKQPDHDDLKRYTQAEAKLRRTRTEYVPDEEIPEGDETNRLHRWGYRRYREMFNARQLLGLELICRAVAEQSDERVRNALATNLSDLLRYQNMLCRYDTYALKSLDIFSVHGFPVGLVECESNLLGILNDRSGVNVGSGGWSNIVEKFIRAKQYCDAPFEVRYQAGRKVQVPIPGEWIGDFRNGRKTGTERTVRLECATATKASLPAASLDAVFTDPPYFANVQYAELMDFCYAWLRRIVSPSAGEPLRRTTTRSEDELTGNATMERGLTHFAEGLSAVFQRMAKALKPGRPLVFTFHHNTIEAYFPLAVAILDARLVCPASLPCPAEMGASIHINGTGSSVIDTVFVCRSTGTIPRRLLALSPEEIACLVLDDLAALRRAGVKATRGDARCIAFGHLIRLAIWRLRLAWALEKPIGYRLARIRDTISLLGGVSSIERLLPKDLKRLAGSGAGRVRENGEAYAARGAEVAF
jgi:adenine-specific DNA methylase